MTFPSLAEEALPLAPGEVLADKYRIERVLGRGGMGFVVAARNINLGKRVAIKMMLPAAMGVPLAIERFEREARAAVQLKSEHVAEVLDIGKLTTGEPYIVMELLEGSDFEALLASERWLAVEDAADYMLQACEAVAEAHALGIVHRDLKPKNMFLSHRLDGTPVVKVLDFGISKWTIADSDSHSLTRTSDVFGSPNYMSPEQIRSARDVDGRTDIWSLGVMLFEMLTGRVPFVAETLPQLCALVLEVQPPSVAELRADVPEGLVAIVARCLEKAPAARIQSVRDLAQALEPFGRPRPARSHSASGQLASTDRMIGSGQLSPSASTVPVSVFRPPSGSVAPPSGVAPTISAVPPPGTSTGRMIPPLPGGAPFSSTTGASWLKIEPEKRTSRWLFALLAIPVLAVGGTLWGFKGRLGPASSTASTAIERDASVAELPTSSTSAAIASASAPPPATASTAPVVSAPGSVVVAPPHHVPTTVAVSVKGAADAGVKLTPQPPPPPPSTTRSNGDPFTPDDRK